MARLSWNQDLNRKFEFGIDRGVLYQENGLGVPWNGIVSINEKKIGADVSSYYFDGVKYLDTKTTSFDQMTLTALSYPQEFDEALGNIAISPGFTLTKQKRSNFGLSYRTKIGNDLGYKLHLVYNAIVKSSNIVYETLNDSSNVKTRSWTIDTAPLDYPGLNPSAHIIFDSTKMLSETLDYLESILYGRDDKSPRLPTMFELASIFKSWKPFTIDYVDSGISSLIESSDNSDLAALTIDGLLVPINTTRLGLTSDPGIYRLES